MPRRWLLLFAAGSTLAACGAGSAVTRRASELFPEVPPGPPSLDRELDLNLIAQQGFWYARYVSDVLAFGAGLGVPFEAGPDDRETLRTAYPGALAIKVPYEIGRLPLMTQTTGFARFRVAPDGVTDTIRVRVLASYLMLLQQMARTHALRAAIAPSPADHRNERAAARVLGNIAAAGTAYGRAELFRSDLGVYFDSDLEYDEPGHLDLMWALADGAALAADTRFGLRDGRRAQRLAEMADEIYTFMRQIFPDEPALAWRMMRAQGRLATVTRSAEFRRFIPVHQRRLGFVLRDMSAANVGERASILTELIRVRAVMPPNSGVERVAGRLFLDIVADFDFRDGRFRSQDVYDAGQVAAVLRGLSAAARDGPEPIERRFAAQMLRIVWHSLVNRSGLMRGAPPGGEGFARPWEMGGDARAFRHPATPAEGPPVFATAVGWDGSGWTLTDENLQPGPAAELALQALRLNPIYDHLASPSDA